jgi:hypothetical protein
VVAFTCGRPDSSGGGEAPNANLFELPQQKYTQMNADEGANVHITRSLPSKGSRANNFPRLASALRIHLQRPQEPKQTNVL